MNNEMIIKVTAYITRINEGALQLLVFKERGFEHLGLQVPGGTVEMDEKLEDAIVREVKEEAGIKPFNLSLLGDFSYLNANGKETKRYYYQMEGVCPETFSYIVQSNDEDNGWIYDYFWLNVEDMTGLYGYLGVHLDKIKLIRY